MSVAVERTYRGAPATPAAVRSFAAEILRLWGCGPSAELACLLVNEVVSNAVIHTGTDVTVRMDLDPPCLRVEVEDGSPVLPEPLDITPESERGRGLFLIQALAKRWGARRTAEGKVVWFEIEVTCQGQPSPATRARSSRRSVAS